MTVSFVSSVFPVSIPLMTKKLNITGVVEALQRTGLNESQLALELGVSRQSTNNWLQGKGQPRPDKVLKMSRILGLSFEEIYETELAVNEPVVAFRKKGNAKTKQEHIQKAKRMGKVLEGLVSSLPFDEFNSPSRIKKPSQRYEYIQRLVSHLREEMKIGESNKVTFDQLISEFTKRQAVLIPVLWGDRNNHGNGLHIYLPESQVTWVYLNLETNILDFKYWMAHELGYILLGENPQVDEEVFCEAFAAEFVFSSAAAEQEYKVFPNFNSTQANLTRIEKIALRYEVSPITILNGLNRFAKSVGMPGLDFGKRIFIAAAKLNKKFMKVSEMLLGKADVAPDKFIRVSRNTFGGIFFDALKKRLEEVDDGAGMVQWVMDIPLKDAKGIAQTLK